MKHEDFSMAPGQCLTRLVNLLGRSELPKQFFFYAALELRFTIERTLFEYLCLIHNLVLSKNLEKFYSAKDLKSEILKQEPKFYEKIDFMSTLAPYMGIEREIRTPDLDLLANCYGVVGNYLHSPKRPEKTWLDPKWWERLEVTIELGVKHLTWIHEGAIAYIDLNEQGQALFDLYVSEEMSLKDVREYLDEYYNK